MLTVLHGHCITELRKLPAESVHCVVTSPPYWGLRDYKTPACEWDGIAYRPMPGMPEIPVSIWTGHLGLEPDPNAFVGHIVAVFREVWRVLRKDGTLWLNFGDGYASNGGHSDKGCNDRRGQYNIGTRPEHEHRAFRARAGGDCDPKRKSSSPGQPYRAAAAQGLKVKDLIGMPWRVAFALQADGWTLRSDIIWHKPAVMPESVDDRPTKAHENVFLLTKGPKYFYDAEAIKEPASWLTHARKKGTSGTGVGFGHGFDQVTKPRVKAASESAGGVNPKSALNGAGSKQNASFSEAVADVVETRNKRSVWTIPSEPFSDAHFATFPKALVVPCILAGTSAMGVCSTCGAPWERVLEKEKGTPPSHAGSSFAKGKTKHAVEQTGRPVSEVERTVATKTVGWQPTCTCAATKSTNGLPLPVIPATVLDPFLGSGTTAQVALELNRQAIGIELGEHHLPMIQRRTHTTPGLPLA